MQGYLTLALDSPKYVEMAVNLANSIRVVDGRRPVCLVYNERAGISPAVRQVFDDFVMLPDDPSYVGVMNKLRLYEVSPYERTMFIDADCLLVKTTIHDYWDLLAGHDFDVAGEKKLSGRWKNFEIADLIRTLRLPHLVQMNNGVFYFEKTRRAAALFQRMRELFLTRRDVLNAMHQDRPGQYSSEPFFGVAMAEAGIDPLDVPPGVGSWMITTWRARRARFEPQHGVSYIEKPSRYRLGVPLLPADWVAHSPAVAHFIKLEPRGLYDRLAAYFAAQQPVQRRTQPTLRVAATVS